jgi:hypothetical protein
MQLPAVGVKLGVVVQLCAVLLPEVSEQVTGIDPVAFNVLTADPPFTLTTVPPDDVPQVGQLTAATPFDVLTTMGLVPETDEIPLLDPPPSWNIVRSSVIEVIALAPATTVAIGITLDVKTVVLTAGTQKFDSSR